MSLRYFQFQKKSILFPAFLLMSTCPQGALAGEISEAPRVASVLTNILEFLLSVVGVIAIIGLVVAGALSLFTAGDEKRAETVKKAVFAAVIGLIIALGGLILIGTLADIVG